MSVPKVLGVEMTQSGSGSCWDVRFGSLAVSLWTGFGERGDGWCATVGEKYVEPSGTRSRDECLPAIERELLAIRAAIPTREEADNKAAWDRLHAAAKCGDALRADIPDPSSKAESETPQ